MRVNVYAEEMTDRIEIIGKEIDGHTVFDRAHLRSIVAEAIDRRRWMRELLATEGAR